MRELGVFSILLEKDILRKFVVASLSGLLPRVFPQPPRSTSNISPPPALIFEASSRKQPPQFMRFADIFTLCLRSYKIFHTCFKCLLGITASDSGEYRKSSEINNLVNTLTPKIYKFSRLISEHFLEEIV